MGIRRGFFACVSVWGHVSDVTLYTALRRLLRVRPHGGFCVLRLCIQNTVYF